MKIKWKKAKHGLVAAAGYMLSPLSWWNDLFLNIPLAYGFAYLFGLISKSLFFPMMVLGYWLTNIVGLIMIHHGVKGLVHDGKKKYARRELIKDLIFSLLYTLIIVIVIKIGWLKFPTEYFQ